MSKYAMQECDPMTFDGLLIWCGALVAVEALTELISSSKIMFPIRDWFSKPQDESKVDELYIKKAPAITTFLASLTVKVRAFIGELLNCGYCTSVWVAGAAAFIVPGTIPGWTLPTILMKWMVLHRLSNVVHERFSRMFHRAPHSFVFTHIHNKE